MTGPEHVKAAREWAAIAAAHFKGEHDGTASATAAIAQVHATLALTAATAPGGHSTWQEAFAPSSGGPV